MKSTKIKCWNKPESCFICSASSAVPSGNVNFLPTLGSLTMMAADKQEGQVRKKNIRCTTSRRAQYVILLFDWEPLFSCDYTGWTTERSHCGQQGKSFHEPTKCFFCLFGFCFFQKVTSQWCKWPLKNLNGISCLLPIRFGPTKDWIWAFLPWAQGVPGSINVSI